MTQFAQVLKYLRKRANLTQQELADSVSLMSICKITRSSINNYENGLREPDFETAEAFADFFNVSMDALIGRKFEDKNTVTIPDDGNQEKYKFLMQILLQLPAKSLDGLIEQAQIQLQNRAVQDAQ